jgi:hypothetical protein
MTAPITFTGTVKAWTTNSWSRTPELMRLVQGGRADQAVSSLCYTNADMSRNGDWIEVGVAQITVTLHPPEQAFKAELDGLKAQLQQVLADNQQRENAIRDRISNLLAIDFNPAPPGDPS